MRVAARAEEGNNDLPVDIIDFLVREARVPRLVSAHELRPELGNTPGECIARERAIDREAHKASPSAAARWDR